MLIQIWSFSPFPESSCHLNLREDGYNHSMRGFLSFAVFVAGVISLGVEFAASRLLEAVFGTSNLVWAAVIGLILLYLAAGYFLGGRVADRFPAPTVFYRLLAWGGLIVALVPVPARPLLYRAAAAFDRLQLGPLLGAFVVVLMLLSVPVTLLGMIAPFAVRLAVRTTEETGRVAGRLYALSTLGSFLGTYLTVLLLIPGLGTRRTFILLGGVLVLTGIVGLLLSNQPRYALRLLWMPFLVTWLYFGWAKGPIKGTPGQVYEAESAYNYIEVIERDGYRYLRLNEGQGIHSVYHPTVLQYNGAWMHFLAGPFLNEPPFLLAEVHRLAILGLAGGTVARQATAIFGPIPIDGYEIDPKVLEVGRRYFGLDALPNLRPYAMDARVGLRRSPYRYDLIVVDAYRPPYIPWHLTTREFFGEVWQHLSTHGVLAINVGRAGEDRRLQAALTATLLQVFPTVYAMDVPGTLNTILYATVQPADPANLEQNLALLLANQQGGPLLWQAIADAVAYPAPMPVGDTIFTDDRAPVEALVNAMVLDFFLWGEIQTLGPVTEPSNPATGP